jgi:hypothetical protein
MEKIKWKKSPPGFEPIRLYMYCDFHEGIAMISRFNKLHKSSFRRNTVRTVRIDVTIMEIS